MQEFLTRQMDFDYHSDKIKLTYIMNIQPENQNTIVFFHANGYSAQTYQKLFRIFTQNHFNVFALNFSGHNHSENYENFSDWFFFRDQIIAFLKYIKHHYSIHHFHLIGHSLGGACSLLATHDDHKNHFPYHVVSVSCWDPVILSPFISIFLPFVDSPLAQIAEKRREEFKSLKLIDKIYKRFGSFKNWDQEVFYDYLHSCFYLDPHTQTYKLCLPKKIEAKIFRSLKYGHWKFYKKIKVPILIYTTQNSKVAPIRSCKILTRNHPESKYIVHPSGSHFFPMEDPENTAKTTIAFIQKLIHANKYYQK